MQSANKGMKKTILIGALALALGACFEQPKENSNVIQVDIENAQPMNLADFVESIQLVPLETTDESLIKRIERMVIQDGKVYIQNHILNVLVYASMPEEVEKHINTQLVDAESLERIKDLKEDDNQVLVIYTLKD